MDISLLIRGLLLGISVAAPVGPMSVLCMRRTLSDGRVAGLITGLAIASADATYAAIGGFGLTAVSGFLNSYAFWLRLLGGLFMCYLGIKIFLTPPAKEAASIGSKTDYLRLFMGAYLLTMTNPTTIFSFAAILASIGLGAGSDFGATGLVVFGIFVGSVLWWLFLLTGISLLRHRLTPSVLGWINRISGLIIIGFGLLAFIAIFS